MPLYGHWPARDSEASNDTSHVLPNRIILDGGSVQIHGLHGDSGCMGYAILGYCEVGGHANWMRGDEKGCIITALVTRTLPAGSVRATRAVIVQ